MLLLLLALQSRCKKAKSKESTFRILETGMKGKKRFACFLLVAREIPRGTRKFPREFPHILRSSSPRPSLITPGNKCADEVSKHGLYFKSVVESTKLYYTGIVSYVLEFNSLQQEDGRRFLSGM